MTPASQRTRVIPIAAWITAGAIFVLLFLVASLVMMRAHDAPGFMRILIPILAPLFVSAYALLVGYIYGDARRRGMRYVLWTLLAIFLTNGIGVILYFILREPLLAHCTRCGSQMQAGFAYCPRCGANILAACPGCHRTLQPGWTHCAWCGAKL